MEVLFFLVIFAQLIVAIMIVQSLMHPIVILKLLCTFSAFVLIFFSHVWGMHISFETLIIFTTGLIWVDAGFLLCYLILKKGRRTKKESKNTISERFSMKWALIMFAFICITIVFYINAGKSYVETGGGLEVFSSSVMMLKQARRMGDVDIGLLQYAMTACTIIGIVYVYASLKEWLENGLGMRIIVFSLPVIATFSLFFITGRRSFLLNMILILLVLTYEYVRRKYKKVPLNFQLKFLASGVILFTFFYFFFVTAGKLLLKGGGDGTSLFNTFAVYLSGGIVAFDNVYQNYSFSSSIFAQNILRLFYEILNFLPGFNFPTDDTITETLYIGNNFATNVYTVNLPYFADFGYLGVLIANILIGGFYAVLFFKSRNEEMIGFWNLLYAFFLIYLLSYTGSERYFVPMTLNLQYLILFIIFIRSPLLYKRESSTK